jgi:hypothetical protein
MKMLRFTVQSNAVKEVVVLKVPSRDYPGSIGEDRIHHLDFVRTEFRIWDLKSTSFFHGSSSPFRAQDSYSVP